MGLDDLGDPAAELAKMRKSIRRIHPVTGDSSHAGAGENSIQLGAGAVASTSDDIAIGHGVESNGGQSVALGAYVTASGSAAVAIGGGGTASGDGAIAIGDGGPEASAYRAVAIGFAPQAEGDDSIAIGTHADAEYSRSTALGADAVATAANQVMLGASGDTVVVPGTFSNPSARRLKQNIEPAPALTGIFTDLFEWEYITDPGTRRIGPMADDLVGTDAERFVQFDADGRPAGINMIGLLVAQVAALNARVAVLENDRRQDG